MIAKLHDLFHYLSYGLALILTFIGLKMLLMKIVHISTGLSLIVVFVLLFLAIMLSVIFPPKHVVIDVDKKN